MVKIKKQMFTSKDYSHGNIIISQTNYHSIAFENLIQFNSRKTFINSQDETHIYVVCTTP